jgi:pimeloyl-ACP methyl ester carboxylesterase
MDHQTPIVFTNRAGLQLFGILHEPEGRARKDVGILLLSPGVKMRVGPQGLYRRMTELFVRLGYPVFRFDFYGLGDSEGSLKETQLVDVYNHIEVGRFVDDTIDALEWMRERCGVSRVIVSGLCGGAITGLLAGQRDERIAGLLALGMTPLLASRAADPATYMTVGQLTRLRGSYLRKLLDVKSWWRLLTFKSDFKLIWKSMLVSLKSKKKPSPQPAGEADTVAPPDNANPLFPPAFFSMLSSKRPMLFVFSGADRLYWEFQEKFVARYERRLRDAGPGYQVHVVADANHVYSFKEWQEEMLAVSARWLNEHFAQRDRHDAAAETISVHA